MPLRVQIHGSKTGLMLPMTPYGSERGEHFPQALSPSDLALLDQYGRCATYAKGEYLFKQGDRHEGIVFILEGRVRTSYISPLGHEMTLAYWPTGHFVGAPQLLGGGTHMWSSEAEKSTQGLLLPGDSVRQIIRAHPDLAIRLIEGLEYKSRCYAAMLQMLATQSKRAMLAKVLLILLPHDDENTRPSSLTLSQLELARMIGATRQTVSLTLDRFEREGLIARQTGNITISNYKGLQRFCE